MYRVLEVLLKNEVVKEGDNVYLNTDELVFEVDSEVLLSTAKRVAQLIYEQSTELNDIKSIVQLEAFELKAIATSHPYFYKLGCTNILTDSVC
jgi:hypothetical protein